jgi:hypothetical protein
VKLKNAGLVFVIYNKCNQMKSSIIVFIILLLLVFEVRLNAQILMSSPYLKVTNSISHNTYKLKIGKKINYLLLNDSVYRKGIIENFLDSNKIIVSQKVININDFVYLKFKPKSKVRRISKLVYYTGWFALVGNILFVDNNNCREEGCGYATNLVIIATPFAIIIGETGGAIIQLLTPKRELFKDYNLKLEVVN